MFDSSTQSTSQNKIKYTSRRGYAYIEETFGFNKRSPCHRVWNKVHAILKYLGDCELLFWIDTDAVFLNMDKTLESFFDTRSNIEFLATWPPRDGMIMLMRNTPTVREFFQNVTSGRTWRDNWCHRGKYEQAAIRDQLDIGMKDGKFKIERNNELQTLCGFKKKVAFYLRRTSLLILHLQLARSYVISLKLFWIVIRNM